VNGERPLAVVFFRTETGAEPVRDWLRSLEKDERRAIGEDILTVQYAWPLGRPLVGYLGSQIWEVRSRLRNRIARTLFIVHEREIVLLHGFIPQARAASRSGSGKRSLSRAAQNPNPSGGLQPLS
jgi:phage-related protein